MKPTEALARDAVQLAPGHRHGLRALVCAQKQEIKMKQTCITLATISLIQISASASELTYYKSRLNYQNQESNSNIARRANLNLGFESGGNQYGLRYIHRNSANNPSTQEANISFGSHLTNRLFVEGMVSSEKGDTYDNRGYGFRSEYQTTLGRLGAFTVHGMMKRRIPEFTPPLKPCRGFSAA